MSKEKRSFGSEKQVQVMRDSFSELQRRPDLVTRQVGFDVVLFDPASDRVHMLNAVAGAVWHHITPDRTFRNIVEALQLSFGEEDPAQIAEDVQRLLEQFQKAGLFLTSKTRLPKQGPRRVRVPIPDGEVSMVTREFQRPEMKTFTLPELEERFKLGTDRAAPFSDLMIVNLPGTPRS